MQFAQNTTTEFWLNLIKAIPALKILAQTASVTQIPSYLVGGFVRDKIMGIECKDIDVLCVGDGTEFAKQAATLAGKKETEVSIFKNFGTAMLCLEDLQIEFVGARKESYSAHSRNPKVSSGTLEDDLNRRDFTINAFTISLNPDTLGQFFDPFSGIKDLSEGIIRTPLEPEITFSDDPLRMLRAIRFASKFYFDIEANTFEAIQKTKDRIAIISQERITEELNKIILSPKPSFGFKLLYHAGLLDIIFPEFVALKGAETRDGKGHKDNFYHTLQVLDNTADVSKDLWLRWAAILHDIAKPLTKKFHPKIGWSFHGHEDKGARMVPKIFEKFKLPLNEKMKSVQNLVRLHLRPIPLVREEITDSAIRRLIVDAGEDLEHLMMLCRADITSKNPEKVKKFLQNFSLVEQKINEVESKDELRNFQPCITGEHIMQSLKIGPSREVGIIKLHIREALLDGKINNSNFEECHNFMLEIAKIVFRK